MKPYRPSPCSWCGADTADPAPDDCPTPARHAVAIPEDFRHRVAWHAARREEQQ